MTRTTRTPAFWGYPPPPHTIESYWSPSQKKTKSKLQILKISQNFEFWNRLSTWHTLWSCLIRCANMKWIRWVFLKIQSGHDSVHRRTDGQGDTSIPPFQLRWSGGINMHLVWNRLTLYEGSKGYTNLPFNPKRHYLSSHSFIFNKDWSVMKKKPHKFPRWFCKTRSNICNLLQDETRAPSQYKDCLS